MEELRFDARREESELDARQLRVSHFDERLLSGSRFCVGGDETTGERDHLSQRGPSLACHLLACPPNKNHCQDYEGKGKESHTKEGQEDQKFADIIEKQIMSFLVRGQVSSLPSFCLCRRRGWSGPFSFPKAGPSWSLSWTRTKRARDRSWFLSRETGLRVAWIHPSITSGLTEVANLNASEEHQDYDDDENEPQASGRPIAPVSTVRPSRERAKERQD